MRKKLCFLILLIVLLASQPVLFTLGDEIAYTENHFVILYDTSASMENADPDHIVSDRIASFLNTIPKEQYPIKVSVVPFDTAPKTELLGTTDGYWYVSDKNDSATLKQIRDFTVNLKYDGEDTDIGSALEYCCKLLEKMRDGAGKCRQTVLFMTDGYIDYLARGDAQKKFAAVMQSYEKVKNVSEEFPEDCFFLGIIPQEDAFAGRVVYDESGENIKYYFDTDVPEEYQKELPAVADAVNYFGSRLVERQPENQIYCSRIKSIDWSGSDTENSFQNVYTEFFDTIFQTKTVMVQLSDDQKDYPFHIPDAISEVNITVTPETEGIKEKRETVSEFLETDAIAVLNESGLVDYTIRDSRSDITVSLMNPKSGNYTIRNTSDHPVAVTLQFTSYGDLRLQCEKQDYNVVLGQSAYIEGTVVSAGEAEISENVLESVTLWYREVNQDKTNEMESQGTRFFTDYIAKSTGSHYVSLGLTYDDTDKGGVTAFSKGNLVVSVNVPSVEYHITCETEKLQANKSALFRITPYSVIDGNEVGVAAADCEQYLGDDWKLEASNGKSCDLLLSEDGQSFEGQMVFEQAGEYEARFLNQGQEVDSLNLQVQDGAVSWLHILLDWIRAHWFILLAAIFVVVILAIILAVVSRRNRGPEHEIIVHYRGEEKRVPFELRENNKTSISFGGKNIEFSYSNGQIHASVDGQEYTVFGQHVYI